MKLGRVHLVVVSVSAFENRLNDLFCRLFLAASALLFVSLSLAAAGHVVVAEKLSLRHRQQQQVRRALCNGTNT